MEFGIEKCRPEMNLNKWTSIKDSVDASIQRLKD